MFENLVNTAPPIDAPKANVPDKGPFSKFVDGYSSGISDAYNKEKLGEARETRKKRERMDRASAAAVKTEPGGKKSFDKDAYTQALLEEGGGLEAFKAQVEIETAEALQTEAIVKKDGLELENYRRGIQLAAAGETQEALRLINQHEEPGERTLSIKALGKNKFMIESEDDGQQIIGMDELVTSLTDSETQYAQAQEWARFHVKLSSDYNKDVTPNVLMGRALQKHMMAEAAVQQGMDPEQAAAAAKYQPFERQMVEKYMKENVNQWTYLAPIMSKVAKGTPLTEEDVNVMDAIQKTMTQPINELLGLGVEQQRADVTRSRLKAGTAKGRGAPQRTEQETKFLEDFRKAYPDYKDKSDDDILKRARDQKLLD